VLTERESDEHRHTVNRHELEPVDAAPALRFGLGGVVGRGEDSDVHLDHPLVSRHHAEVVWSPGGWVVRDLRSSNGTYVNGVRVDDVHVLRPGQQVRFGEGGPAYVVERVRGRA
jgi:predicted component of type VI protein secretion system